MMNQSVNVAESMCAEYGFIYRLRKKVEVVHTEGGGFVRLEILYRLVNSVQGER